MMEFLPARTHLVLNVAAVLVCWSGYVLAGQIPMNDRLMEDIGKQIHGEKKAHLQRSAVPARTYVGSPELNPERRNIDNIENGEDRYGQTVLINGKEHQSKVPERPNPMNFENRDVMEDNGASSLQTRKEPDTSNVKGQISKRNFDVDFQKKLWTNNKVPYVIMDDTFGSKVGTAKYLINAAIQMFKKYTCVEWVPRTDETYYVKFKGDEYGCYATVGFVGFRNGQTINYAAGCLEIESVLHEMYHTIGANHEIQRLDRSNHVNVLWNNIFPSYMKQFAVTRETRDRFPYDYHSVMQYRLSTLSKSSGLNSISLKRPELSYLATIPKYGFSFLDIADINDAYQCTEGCTNRCQNGGFPIKPVGGNCQCHCPSGLKGDNCEDVDTSDGCGGIITLPIDGRYSLKMEAYRQDRECTWLFKGVPGSRIRAYVLQMELPYDSNKECLHWLEFRDYHIGTPGQKLCGSMSYYQTYTKDVSSDPSMMMIRFNTRTPVASTKDKLFFVYVRAFPSGCASSPCKNGGVCSEIYDSDYVCSCSNGFSGENCEQFDDDGYNFCDFSDDFHTCLVHQDIASSDFFWVFTTRICRDHYCKTAIKTDDGNQILTINPLYNQYKLYNKKSYLVSDVVFAMTHRCLTFDYNLGNNSHGDYQTTVRVYREGRFSDGYIRDLLWEVKSTTNYIWKQANINIYATANLKIVIEAVMGPQELGIDNMKLRFNPCDRSVCDEYTCRNGGTCTPVGNPPTSFTCACREGYTGVNCREITDCYPYNQCKFGGRCVHSQTSTEGTCACPNGYSGDFCQVQTSPCGINLCLNGGTCVPAQAGENTPYTCSCPAGYTGANCEVVTCTFEDEKVWCGFTYVVQGTGWKWATIKGPTPSPNTGPMKAQEGEKYLYLEGSGVGEDAYSILHVVRDNKNKIEGDHCLSFFYSMIGADVGYFKVVLFDSADWSYRYELSRLGPQLGGEWLMFEKTAYMYNSTYILFYGSKQNTGFRSDIAIDNISLKPGHC